MISKNHPTALVSSIIAETRAVLVVVQEFVRENKIAIPKNSRMEFLACKEIICRKCRTVAAENTRRQAISAANANLTVDQIS